MVGRRNLGSAMTLGSGVPTNAMYELARAQGKIAVGGISSTVVPSGGYVQGGGHSALSPNFGLIADNCLGRWLLAFFLFHSPTLIHFKNSLWSLPMAALLQRIALKILIVRSIYLYCTLK